MLYQAFNVGNKPSGMPSWSETKCRKQPLLSFSRITRSTDENIKNSILNYIEEHLNFMFPLPRYSKTQASDGGLEVTSLTNGHMDADFVRRMFMEHVEEMTERFTTVQDFEKYFETQEAYNKINGVYHIKPSWTRIQSVFNDAIEHETKRLDNTYGKPK